MQQEQLLETKVCVPAISPSAIPRPRLIEQLNERLQHKVTFLSVPAGYGKTTLLCQWSQSLDRNALPLAWLSLHESDNDEATFWRYVCFALASSPIPICQKTLNAFYAEILHEPQAALGSLLNDVAKASPFVLVLDNCQVITNPTIRKQFAFILNHMPSQMHLVCASRNGPPRLLDRLGAHGHMLELYSEDLRFTHQEIETFYRAQLGFDLPMEALATLEAHTEGWATGLQIYGHDLRRQQAEGIKTPQPSSRYDLCSRYLEKEVFCQQPEQVQQFLLQTSILERLNGFVCNVVTGESNGQEILQYLVQHGALLFPADRDQQWYRYHPLFAQMLRTRLKKWYQQDQARTKVEELHQRAFQWYKDHQLVFQWYKDHRFFPEAITHALASERLDQAIQFVEQFPAEMLLALEQIRSNAEASEYEKQNLELLVLEAFAHEAQGNADLTTSALQKIESDVNAVDDADAVDDANSIKLTIIKACRQRGTSKERNVLTILRQLSKRGSQVSKGEQQRSSLLSDPLSERELEVLKLLADGTRNKQIAERLVISANTVRRHVSNIISKLGVDNRTQAVIQAQKLGIL